MPLEYAGGGVLKEHAAVREAVGVFDVSHLGKAGVGGPGAADFVNACLTNDLGRIGPGQAQYTLCCDDATGGVVDDLIAYLFADDDVFLIPNAANTAEVVRRLAAAAPAGRHGHRRAPDVRRPGRAGPAVGASCSPRSACPTEHDYMSLRHRVARRRRADRLPDRLHRRARLRAGRRRGTTPARGVGRADRRRRADAACGLGARDTLRTEMGYPLHGQDLSLEITPGAGPRPAGRSAGSKPAFWGRDALLAEKAAGPRRTLRGLELHRPRHPARRT